MAEIVSGSRFYVSTANISEFIYGFATTPRAKENLARWEVLSGEIGVIVLRPDQSAFAGQLQARLRKVGKQLKTIDAQQATQVLLEDMKIVTTDSDFD